MGSAFFERTAFAARRPRAVIYGMAGEALTEEERRFFAAADPFGFILFSRNCGSPDQVRALIAALRSVTGRERIPVLIDQEGGRVARLRPPRWRAAPPAGAFAARARPDREAAERAVYYNARLIAAEAADLGIAIDCAPVADIRCEGAHDIIGDRAYGTAPEEVAALARRMAQGLLDGGVLPVVKHIPGHGRALVDSHEALPTVNVPRETLEATDFLPFRELSDMPAAMTAHILYTALDPLRVATLSPAVISLIREDIGFGGLLLSDDLSMKALKGDLGALARGALGAGCDIALHCNGNMAEMRAIAQDAPEMTDDGMERARRAFAMLREPEPLDMALAEREVASFLERAAA